MTQGQPSEVSQLAADLSDALWALRTWQTQNPSEPAILQAALDVLGRHARRAATLQVWDRCKSLCLEDVAAGTARKAVMATGRIGVFPLPPDAAGAETRNLGYLQRIARNHFFDLREQQGGVDATCRAGPLSAEKVARAVQAVEAHELVALAAQIRRLPVAEVLEPLRRALRVREDPECHMQTLIGCKPKDPGYRAREVALQVAHHEALDALRIANHRTLQGAELKLVRDLLVELAALMPRPAPPQPPSELEPHEVDAALQILTDKGILSRIARDADGHGATVEQQRIALQQMRALKFEPGFDVAHAVGCSPDDAGFKTARDRLYKQHERVKLRILEKARWMLGRELTPGVPLLHADEYAQLVELMACLKRRRPLGVEPRVSGQPPAKTGAPHAQRV